MVGAERLELPTLCSPSNAASLSRGKVAIRLRVSKGLRFDGGTRLLSRPGRRLVLLIGDKSL